MIYDLPINLQCAYLQKIFILSKFDLIVFASVPWLGQFMSAACYVWKSSCIAAGQDRDG